MNKKHKKTTCSQLSVFCNISFLWPGLSEVIVITTKEVQRMMSADPKKLDMKIKLDVEGIQDDSDMGTADALRHIQRKIKVRDFGNKIRKPFHLLQSWLV